MRIEHTETEKEKTAIDPPTRLPH